MHGSDASRYISVSDQGDYPYSAGCKGRGISVVVVAAKALKPSHINRLFGWHRLGGNAAFMTFPVSRGSVGYVARAIVAAIVAGLFLAVPYAGADTADERAFVRDVRSTTVVLDGVSDAQIISFGWQTCDELVNWPAREVVNQAVLNGVPEALARRAVVLAVQHLCPNSAW